MTIMTRRRGRGALPLVLAGGLAACANPDPTVETTGDATNTATSSLDEGFESVTTDTDSSSDTDTSSSPDLPDGALSDCERLVELLDALALEADPDARATAIAAFLREVSYGEHGFPIADPHKLAVVHLGAPGQVLSVAGDFNAWDPTSAALVEAVPGFYYAIVELDAAPTGLYKLVRNADEFFADPLARRFSWDEFGEYSQIDAVFDRGHHERWPEFDLAVGELAARTLTVYVPIAAATEPDLPVVYMHDGQNLFAPDALFGGWRASETVEQAIAAAVLEPMLIVGIDNTPARFDEYTPVPDLIDNVIYGGRADEYAAFVVDGVKPFIESRYDVATSPDQVAVLGSSLGGLVSLYIGLHYPDEFGKVGSMSGTVDWGSIGAANPTILDAYQPAPPLGLHLYLDSGGGEGLGCPDDGSDNYCGNVEFADALRGWGWVDEVDLFYRWQPGAPHNEAAWAERLLPALADWF